MIITRTPFRVSFFGGGTDYPSWVVEHGGAVLSTAINKYCYISCRTLPPFFDHKHRVVYSRIEDVKNVDEIQHPSVKACMEWVGIDTGLEIHHDGDLPARAGLGSSSSFTVGLLNALHGLRGSLAAKQRLAEEAIHVEQNLIGENVGAQDQVAAAFGGFNRITFNANGSFDVEPFCISRDRRYEFQSHLMLFFTGMSRFASEVAASKIANFRNREKELKLIRSMVDDAVHVIGDPAEPITQVGEMLDISWHYKRELSDSVSNPYIDQLYASAREAGAIGGKLLGAGGGGFLLVFAKPDRQARIREKLEKLIHVPFEFENAGSRVIFYEPT